MGLLLTAAPSGAERPTDPRSGCGNDLRPSSDGCPSQAGEAFDGNDGDDSPSGEGCNALGGARAGPHADSEISCCAGNESPGGGDSRPRFVLPAAAAVSSVCDRWSLDCGPRPDCSSGPSWEPQSWLRVCMRMHKQAVPAGEDVWTCVGMSVVVISRDA